VGPASEQAGLQLLGDRVAKLPGNTPIVVYCGCCPWGDCPNVPAACEAIRALGFTKVKAPCIAHNFGADWIDQGYPATR